jgi:hypothetical protein
MVLQCDWRLGNKKFWKNTKKPCYSFISTLRSAFFLKAQTPKLVIPTLIGVQNVAWIEDQNLLISAAIFNRNIQIWQPKDGRLLSNIMLPDEYAEVEDIAVSSISKNVVTNK